MAVIAFFRFWRIWPRPGDRLLPILLLIGLTLVLDLPGFFTLQPMDRDEPRFAQASRQMLESGDFVDIRFLDQARNNKPVGIYWLQSGAVALGQALGVPEARTAIWLYRLPSLAGAMAVVLLTWWAALALVGETQALVAAVLLASTILLGVEARLAKTDAVMTATVVAAMGVLARHWMARAGAAGPAAQRMSAPAGWGLAGVFWLAIGAGILVKGPVTPLVPGLAVLALTLAGRRHGAGSLAWLRVLKPLAGLALCLAIVLPWLVLIMRATGGAFLQESVGGDMLRKVMSAQQSHGAPPLAHLAAFFATGWPMAPLAGLAAPFVWRARREPAVAFLLAWLVPGWLLFELIPTKLPHYVLPFFPAIAILTAHALGRQGLARAQGWRCLLWLVPGIALALVLAGLAGSMVLGAPAGRIFYGTAPFVVWQAWRVGTLIRRGADEAMVLNGVGLAALAYVMVYSGILTGPVFQPFALSPRLVAIRDQVEADQPPDGARTACTHLAAVTSGYREPSLVFLAGSDTIIRDGAGAGAFMAGGPCRIAFVTRGEEPAFLSALHAAPGDSAARPRLVTRVAGINLNGGHPLDIGVYVRQEKGP